MITQAQINTFLAFVGVTLLAIIAFFIKQAWEEWKADKKTTNEHSKVIAVHIEKHEKAEEKLGSHDTKLEKHEERLNTHDVILGTRGANGAFGASHR